MKNQGKSSGVSYVSRVLRGVRIEELKRELKKAQDRCGKNKAMLFLDMLVCAARYGAGYHDYVMFAFYNMDHAHRDTYVTRLRNKKMVVQLNDADTADGFDRKSLFDTRFREFLGRDFLVVESMTQQEFNAFMADKDVVFAKPDVGESGKGIERLKKEEFDDLDKMFHYVKKKKFGVVEEQLKQHEALSKLYPFAINSLRIVTLVTELDGKREAQCVYAVVKTGNGGHFVDNLENGGLFCPLDRETGKICGVAHTSALTNFEIHPYTGVPLLGYEIPYVKEAIELCKKAALVEPKMRFLGWDVCITPTGPAIIEGNDYAGYDFWQQPEHTPDQIGLWHYYKKMLPELEL